MVSEERGGEVEEGEDGCERWRGWKCCWWW